MLDRLRNCFRRDGAEFDQEIETHVALLAERFVHRGMAPEEARRAAVRQFGNAAALREARHDLRPWAPLETMWQDIRYGARALRRTPGVTAVVILTLMLGVGVNTALYSVVYSVLLRPLPYRDPDRLVFMAEHYLADGVGAADFLRWRANARSFDAMAAFQVGSRDVVEDGITIPVPNITISESLGTMLGVAPRLGRDFLPEEVGFRTGAAARRTILVSDRFFRERLRSDRGALGKTLVLSNIPYVLVGVLPPDFRFSPPGPFGPAPEPDLIENMLFDPAQLRGRGFAVQVIGHLKPGVKLETARAEIETINAAIRSERPSDPKATMVMMPLHDRIVGGARASLYLLWGAVGFVLLVACVNVANLLLVRAASRSRETAVRTALGAARVRLIRQFLIESVLLSLAGGAAGVGLAYRAIRLIVNRSPNMPRLQDTTLNWNVLLFSFAVCALAGVLSGLAAALAGHRGNPGDALKEGGRTGYGSRRRHRVHGLLVISEFALALMLLAGAGLMLKSLWLIRTETAVYAPERVLTTALNARRMGNGAASDRYLGDLTRRIESLPGVLSASIDNWAGGPLRIAGLPAPPADQDVMVQEVRVTPHYPQTLGVRLIAGRWLTDADQEGAPRVMVVNEALARWYAARFPDGGPLIGRQIDSGRPPYFTIVGIVANFRWRPDALPEPQAFVTWRQWSLNGLGNLAVRTTGDPMTAAHAIRDMIHESAGVSMTGIRTLEDRLYSAVAPRRFQAVLLAIFAGLALLLAMAGAYGVLSFAVAERTHEIGVRIALGAARADVFRIVLARAVRLALAGAAIGLCGATALTRWMNSLLYGVKAGDPWTYAAVSLLLIAVAGLAAFVPARRAVRVDPMEALRYE
jgi:putative ABC transport system permease protein